MKRADIQAHTAVAVRWASSETEGYVLDERFWVRTYGWGKDEISLAHPSARAGHGGTWDGREIGVPTLVRRPTFVDDDGEWSVEFLRPQQITRVLTHPEQLAEERAVEEARAETARMERAAALQQQRAVRRTAWDSLPRNVRRMLEDRVYAHVLIEDGRTVALTVDDIAQLINAATTTTTTVTEES